MVLVSRLAALAGACEMDAQLGNRLVIRTLVAPLGPLLMIVALQVAEDPAIMLDEPDVMTVKSAVCGKPKAAKGDENPEAATNQADAASGDAGGLKQRRRKSLSDAARQNNGCHYLAGY